MKKYLFILIVGLFYVNAYSQDINHKIKFHYFENVYYPCDPPEGFSYWKEIVEYKDMVMKVIADGNEINPADNSVHNFSCSEIDITVSGEVKITWELTDDNLPHGTGTRHTETVTFDDSTMTIKLDEYFDENCKSQNIILTEGPVGTCSNGAQRIHELRFGLQIMPYQPLTMAGQKKCMNDTIALEALSTHTTNDWYVSLDENNWEYLVSGTSKVVDATDVFDALGTDPTPGEEVWFSINHGCTAFPNPSDYPRSAAKLFYPNPVPGEGAIQYLTPSCVGDGDGKITVGLIDGISPTYFKFGLHHMEKVTGSSCAENFANVTEPITYSGSKYCPSGVGGNYAFNDDPNITQVELRNDNHSGGITTLPAGLWLLQAEYDSFATDTFCNYCAFEKYDSIIDPPQPALTLVNIPEYTYAEDTFNIKYKGAESNITFNYENGTSENEITISGKPYTGEQTSFSLDTTAGTYTLQIEDENGCPFEIPDIDGKIHNGQFILTEPALLTLGDTIKDIVSCHHENVSYTNDGVAQIYVSGGIGPYEFTLGGSTKYTVNSPDNNIAFSVNFNNLDYGLHNFTIKPLYGVEQINGAVFIDDPDPLVLWIDEIKDPICSPISDGEIVFHGSGGTDNYKFYLNSTEEKNGIPELTLDSIGGLNINTDYTVRIEDVNGCITDSVFRMDEYANPLRFDTLSTISEVCLGGADGSVVLHAYGGHDNIYETSDFVSYEIIYQEQMVEEGTSSHIKFQNLYSDSTYSVTLMDSKNCFITQDVGISDYSSPLGFTKGLRIPPNCIGGDDGSIQLQGFGGHETIYDDSYYELLNYSGEALSTQSPDITISNLFGDSIYTVTLGDKAGCSETDTIFLGEEPNPVQPLLLDSAEERCYEYKDGWIQVSGTSGEKPHGGYNYFLTGEDQFSMNPSDPKDTSLVKSGEEAMFYNLPPGLHSIYISDENDCLNENITANRNAYRTDFYVEPQDLLQYEYEKHNSSTIGAQDGYIQITISGGNDKYEYQVIDKKSITVVESGKIGVGTFDLGTLKEGEYSLQFKDTCGCSNSNLEWINYDFNIIDPADSLGMDIIQINEPLCYGYSDGSVVVQGKDGWGFYEYGIDSVYSGNEDGILTGLPSGYHNICVKDKEGAQYCELVYIDQPDTLLPVVEEITDVQCHNGLDGIVALDVMGGTMPYQYSSDDVNWQADSSLTGFSKGIYTLYIKDAHECKVSIEAELDHPELFTMDYSITNTICGETHGSIACTINGGTPPYNYSWFMVDTEGEHQIPDQTAIAGNLAGGKYKLYLNDAHLCDTSWVFIVNNTDGPELTINSFDHVSCSGMVDGAIYYTIEQGVAPYYVELQSGAEVINTIVHENAGTYSFTGLADGNYRLMVRDANPCVQSSEELSIEVPNPVIISLNTLIHPVCYGDTNGQISVHAEGGNGNYVYQWSTGENSNSISNLISGSYSVTVTDSKGCYDEETYEIVDPEMLTVEIGDEETLCEGQTYPLSAEGFTTYNWVYNGETISAASEIEVWAAGEYTLHVTDENGCQADDSFVLSISNDLLEAEFLMPSEANVNDTVVAIDISWPEPENVVWSFSSGIININSEDYLEEFTFDSPGTYTISLTSYKAMCIDSVSKQIVVLADTSSMEKSFLGANPLIKYFNVFPNPNDGKFSVQVELEYNTGITVDLYSVQQNRLVFRQKGSGQSYYSMEYGFTNLQQGVYLVILYVENEKCVERILIF